MGDRTYVFLTVPLACREQVEAITEEYQHVDVQDKDLVVFHFDEVNFGELDCLPQLTQAGIPFTNRWAAGSNYGTGEISVRFTPEGDVVKKELADENNNPSMARLINLIDDPVALRQYILDYKASREVLPWDNQVEYGKRYQALRLIDPALK